MLALTVHASAAPEIAATVFDVRPVAKRFHADEKLASLRVGNQLWVGDRLRLQPSGQVKLVLVDGSLMKVEGGSDLVLDKPASGLGQLIKLASGLVNIVAAKQGQGSLKVRTSNAVAGVKGTQFQVAAGESSTEVKVLEGSVELSPGQGGPATLVEGGQAVIGYADRVSEARQLSFEEIKALRAAFRDLVEQKKQDYLDLVRETQARNRPSAKP